MQDSSDGPRSIIGRNVIVDSNFWDATALVEHCRNPNQLEQSSFEDDRNQAECHSRLYVAIPDDEIQFLLRDDAACETNSNLNFASPIKEACLYDTISIPQCFVNTPAGCSFFNRGILPNPPVDWESTQTMPIPWKVPLPVKVAMLWCCLQLTVWICHLLFPDCHPFPCLILLTAWTGKPFLGRSRNPTVV